MTLFPIVTDLSEESRTIAASIRLILDNVKLSDYTRLHDRVFRLDKETTLIPDPYKMYYVTIDNEIFISIKQRLIRVEDLLDLNTLIRSSKYLFKLLEGKHGQST